MIDYIATKSLALNAKYYTHFFDKDTMRFFNSRLAELAYIVNDDAGVQHAYFVTSEKGPDNKRGYTVRHIVMTPGSRHWNVTKVGEFQAYKTGKAANDAALKIAKDHASTQTLDELNHNEWWKRHIALRDKNRKVNA